MHSLENTAKILPLLFFVRKIDFDLPNTFQHL